MLNECKPALLPSGGTSRVAKYYSTLIANLLKLAHQGLLFLREFFQSLKRMLVPMNRKLVHA
jgi:uncharacterized protein YllA (UPF0747 family)